MTFYASLGCSSSAHLRQADVIGRGRFIQQTVAACDDPTQTANLLDFTYEFNLGVGNNGRLHRQ